MITEHVKGRAKQSKQVGNISVVALVVQEHERRKSSTLSHKISINNESIIMN